MDTIRILFVCHGDICRSAMAKFILKALVKARGPEVRVVKTMAVSHHFPSSRVKVWVTKKGVHMYLP